MGNMIVTGPKTTRALHLALHLDHSSITFGAKHKEIDPESG